MRSMRSSGAAAFLLGPLGACCFAACVGDDPSTGASPDAATGDGASDAGSAADTESPITDGSDADAAPRCNPSAPFGAPELVTELDQPGSANMYPRPTTAGMYLTSDRHSPAANVLDFSQVDLYFAPRSGAGLGTPIRLTTTSTAGPDSAPTESSDGLSLYFDSAVDGGARRLHRATRQSVTGTYGTGTVLTPFADSVNDTAPYLVGTTLYFASQRGDAGGFRQLYRVAVDDAGLAGTPSPVPGIDMAWDVLFPVVSSDEKTIYFSRIVTGSQVYVATRGGTSVPFEMATELIAVNTKPYATVTAVSADGCELHLHLRGENERFAPYRARRPR